MLAYGFFEHLSEIAAATLDNSWPVSHSPRSVSLPVHGDNADSHSVRAFHRLASSGRGGDGRPSRLLLWLPERKKLPQYLGKVRRGVGQKRATNRNSCAAANDQIG
jgi:hypothetical protein